MQYLLIIIFLISTSALILAILAFTRKNGEKYLVTSNTTITAPDPYTKKNNNSYTSIKIVAMGGDSTTGLLRTVEGLELIKDDLLDAQNVGNAFSKFKSSWKPSALPLPKISGSTPGRYFLTAAVVDTSLFAIGGSNGGTAISDVLVYDGGKSWSPLLAHQMNTPRVYHTTVTWSPPQWRNMVAQPSQAKNATFFVIAGTSDVGTRWGKQVQSYNPQNYWADLPDLQSPLQLPAAGIYYRPYWMNTITTTDVWKNDRIVVMGGINNKGVSKDVETLEIFPAPASQWTKITNVFSLSPSDNNDHRPPGVTTSACANNSGGCQLSHANLFLVKGPPRPGSPEYQKLGGNKAITYLVAIPILKVGTAPYLYDIPLHCINKPKDGKNGWIKSKQPITCNPAKPAPWTTTFSIVENITKYFYGDAKPIGKYIKNGSVWCDDYCKEGQHNYIFIAGGSTNGNPTYNAAAVGTCGILDIKITENNPQTPGGGQSVFTATYTQGPPMMSARFGAGGAVMAT